MPENAVFVGRPTKYGNPHKITDYQDHGTLSKCTLQAKAVEDYKKDYFQGRLGFSAAQAKRDLSGKDLACWCKEGTPCHADFLLDLANN